MVFGINSTFSEKTVAINEAFLLEIGGEVCWCEIDAKNEGAQVPFRMYVPFGHNETHPWSKR